MPTLSTLALITVPFFTGAIGYVTNWTGVLMLFYPVHFRGWRAHWLEQLAQLLPHKIQQIPGIMIGGVGWQGIVPSRDGIEVLEQPSFWDIRARQRLVIPYDEVSEQLGYEIDAYSIQHEMSTHYGRMVATDDSLMLFSDPTEAMEHLLS